MVGPLLNFFFVFRTLSATFGSLSLMLAVPLELNSGVEMELTGA